MKINQIEANFENKYVYGYKHDGNTVTVHRWKVSHLCGNLYLQEPQADEYGQRYAHVALFFPGVKIGLEIGELCGWQLDRYSVEDLEEKINFATADTLGAAINATMSNGGYIKDSYIAFVRQYDEVQADKMQSYKKEWKERKERERRAEIEEQKRKEELERQERECDIAESLEKAERTIISGGYIDNKELDGKTLFLRLFDKHKVNVPIRSRGWIIKKLSHVTQFINGSATIYWEKTRKNEKASDGFVSAYFELRNYLIAAQESTGEEISHILGKAV